MELPGVVGIDATVAGSTTVSIIYVIIADSTATFTSAPAITSSDLRHYHAALMTNGLLTMGAHAGSLAISLCSDPACNTVLGRTTVGYTVTVTENPVLTGTWSPGTVQLTAVQGDRQLHWPVGLTVGSMLSGYARLADAANVVQGEGTGPFFVNDSFITPLSLTVSTNLAPGQYSGTLDATFCSDMACTKAYRGVTSLPYQLTILPMTNLTTLAAIAGGQDWTTIQGSAMHAGYVPITVDVARLSPRWHWTSPDPVSLGTTLDLVTSSGKIYTVDAANGGANINPNLYAIDEATGSVAWSQQLTDTATYSASVGAASDLTAPVIAGGSVFVARAVGAVLPHQGRIFSFRLDNGAAQFAPHDFATFPGLFEDYYFVRQQYALAIGRAVYLTPRGSSLLLPTIDDTYARSFVSVDQGNGSVSVAWPACAVTIDQLNKGGAVAVDANQASYLATDTGLVLPDTCQTIASSVPLAAGLGPTVIPGRTDVLAVGRGNVVMFDIAALQVKWAIPATSVDVFVGSPAVVGGTLYLQNSGRVQVEARAEIDGALLWSWKPPSADDLAFIGNVIATQNLLFVSTDQRVYAIDLATHQTVWTYPYGGRLSISSNGILYVNRGGAAFSTDGIAAINLH
jgi:outer membrane protein assembly factor BamB